jgi:uncharacterized membrane protein YhaH (DUF805 family)
MDAASSPSIFFLASYYERRDFWVQMLHFLVTKIQIYYMKELNGP